jgi:hypothetical protein
MPMRIAGKAMIMASKLDEIKKKIPIPENDNPPNISFFHAIIVKKINTKLGIRCINNAIGQSGSWKTSSAKMLMKRMNAIETTRGSQKRSVFIYPPKYSDQELS